MSTKYLLRVWEGSSARGAALLLELALAGLADDDGTVSASASLLARRSRLSVRHVTTLLHDYVERGKLDLTQAGGGGTTASYRLVEHKESPAPAAKRSKGSDHPLVRLALAELPTTDSTEADYRRTVERYRERLSDGAIERVILDLAAKPKYHEGKARLHLTLAKWLNKEPYQAAPSYQPFIPPIGPDDGPPVPMPKEVAEKISSLLGHVSLDAKQP